MTPQDLAADLRTRINPQYAAQFGTESYERRLCAEAIEGLIAERDTLKADAELGRIAMRFVDRAGDYCDIDPAERICDQFYKAMSDQVIAARDAAMKGKS